MTANRKLCRVPLLSDEEFCDYVYRIGKAEHTHFKAAKKELLSNPHSEVAKNRLKALADQGYIPALYPLISNQLNLGNIPQALELSYQGAREADPICAATLASMYAQPCDYEDEQYKNAKAQAVELWLYNASIKRIIYDSKKQAVISAYVNNTAQEYLRAVLQESQEVKEQLFLQFSDEQLNKYEKEMLKGDLVDSSLACFLIKKHINTNSNESKKRALGLAEKIVSDSIFYPEQLDAGGIRAALESLNNEHTPAKIKTRVSQVLANWHEKEVCRSEFVEVYQKEPKRKFVSPGYSPEVLQELIHEAPNVYEGIDLVEAALYLHLHRSKDSRALEAMTSCLERALQDPDPMVRQAIIEYCVDDLLPFSEKAMNKYATELQANAGLLEEEANFMNAHLQALIKKAGSGDDQAAMRVYDLVKNHGSCFTCIPEESRESVCYKYHKQAFEAGNYTAVCMGLPAARAMNPKTTTELSEAMRFWAQVYKSSVQNRGISHVTPAPVALEKESYEKILELKQLKIAVDKNADARFYFYLTYVLAHKDPVGAIEALCKALEISSLERDASCLALYETTGIKEFLEARGKEGKGWAHFAQGCFIGVTTRSMQCRNEEDCLYTIKSIERARTCLKNALNASEPYKNDALLNETALDINKGMRYYRLFQLNKKQIYLQKAVELYNDAIAKGHSQALYEYAKLILNGHDQKGQRGLEQAIDYIIRSTNQNNCHAYKLLQSIEQKGLYYVSECGGTITAELKKRIDACLENKKKEEQLLPSTDQSNTAVDIMSHEEEYALIKRMADQGNIEAKISVAMKLRDGNGVKQSVEDSHEYFTQALLEWDGKTNKKLFGVAWAALVDANEQDVRVRAARAKYQVHDLVSQMETKVLTDQQMNERLSVLNNDINYIMAARKGTHANNQLFYTSGLAQLIKDTISIFGTEDIFLYNLLDAYMKRLQAFPDEIKDDKKSSLLTVPVKAIIFRSHGLLKVDVGAVTMSQEEEAANKRALESLNAVIKKDIWATNKEQLEYLKALALIMKSIHEAAKSQALASVITSTTQDKSRNASDLIALFATQSKSSYSEASTMLNALSKRKYADAIYMQGYLAIHGNALNPCITKENARGMALLEELAKQKHINALFTLTKIYSEEMKKTNKTSERLSYAKKMEKNLATIVSIEPENQFALTLLLSTYVDNPQMRPSNLPEGSSEKECVDYILGLLPRVAFTQPVKDICSMILRIRKNEMSLDLLAHIQHCLTMCESVSVEIDRAWQALEEHYVRDFSKKFDQWANNYSEQEKAKKKSNKQLVSQIYAINQWLHTLIARAFKIRMQIEKDYPALKSKIQKEAEEKAYQCYKKSCEYPSALSHLLMSGLELMSSRQVSPDQLQQAQNYIEKAMIIMEQENLHKENVPLFESSLNDYLLYVKNFLPEKYTQAQAFADKYRKQFAQ